MARFVSCILFLSLGLLPFLGHNHEINPEYFWGLSSMESSKKSTKHVVLLGASVGKAWNIPELPQRVGDEEYRIEYIYGSGFDKSAKLAQILSRQDNKPDAIFLKECAAYFPGEFEQFKSLMNKWVQKCHNANVVPIPTTVVPVTRLHPFIIFVGYTFKKDRDPLKYGNPFSSLRHSAIIEYNDWIREYSEEASLAYLDLEKAVRYSEKNRFLREDFSKIDGLHVNGRAYKKMDQIVLPTLEKVKWK